MKKCSYRGKEYADAATICPVDGQPVINRKEPRQKPAARPADTQSAFNAKLVSPISFAGTYRIFVERNDLIFIQIQGGSRSILEALAPALGPFGGLIPLVLWLFTKREAKARLERLQAGKPEELLRDNEKNFKLYLAEIRDAAIEAPSFLAAGGKAGRLNFLVRHGDKIKCEVEATEDLSAAICLLVPLLGSTLKVNVEWNAQKRRFERKKKI